MKKRCGLNSPDFIVFDLDPYIYSGGRRKEGEKEPEYNIKAFKSTVDVAYDLKDFFDALTIRIICKDIWKNRIAYFCSYYLIIYI